jgi:hypothetical protein
MSANEIQVGGTHYRGDMQHWDYVVANELNYFEGQITKYVTRARRKNGLEDLKKAQHFLAKWIEVYEEVMFRRAAEAQKLAKNSGWQQDVISYQDEMKQREYFTIEGHRADGFGLFKCRTCGQEGWSLMAPRTAADHASTCPLAQHPLGLPDPF